MGTSRTTTTRCQEPRIVNVEYANRLPKRIDDRQGKPPAHLKHKTRGHGDNRQQRPTRLSHVPSQFETLWGSTPPARRPQFGKKMRPDVETTMELQDEGPSGSSTSSRRPSTSPLVSANHRCMQTIRLRAANRMRPIK